MTPDQEIKDLKRRVEKLERSQSVFSIRRIENVSYTRRHEQGFTFLGYSVLIRAFGWELKGINFKFIKSFWK